MKLLLGPVYCLGKLDNTFLNCGLIPLPIIKFWVMNGQCEVAHVYSYVIVL